MLTQRRLGRQGLEVSALGLGCMGMNQSYGVRNDPESVATLQRAVDARFDGGPSLQPAADGGNRLRRDAKGGWGSGRMSRCTIPSR